MSLFPRAESPRKARQNAADASHAVDDEDARTCVVPVRIGAIIRALEKEALAGSANAARELRSWLADYPPSDGTVSVDELDRQTRDRILARLLAELDEESPANDDNR